MCQDPELSKLDDQLNSLYLQSLARSAQPNNTKAAERFWLKSQRNICKTKACLKQSYEDRIQDFLQINHALGAIANAPPHKKMKPSKYYTMVMSKNNALCNTVRKIYNADMNKFGFIKYDTHNIFSKIEWDPIDEYHKYAYLDINNNNNKEIVIKESAPRGDVEIDTIFIFPENSDILSKLGPAFTSKLFRSKNILFGNGEGEYYQLTDTKSLGKLYGNKIIIFRKSPPYQLNKTPQNKDVTGKKWCLAPSIGDTFVLNPFRFDHTTYISLTDASGEWIVIAKYLYQSKLHDMCYFKK